MNNTDKEKFIESFLDDNINRDIFIERLQKKCQALYGQELEEKIHKLNISGDFNE